MFIIIINIVNFIPIIISDIIIITIVVIIITTIIMLMKKLAFRSLLNFPTNIFIFPRPGNDKCSRGCSDDPWRGLRLHGGLRVRLSVHHQENPQPHSCDAQTQTHPAAGGDVLAAPKDGRLFPHLLPVECQAAV